MFSPLKMTPFLRNSHMKTNIFIQKIAVLLQLCLNDVIYIDISSVPKLS